MFGGYDAATADPKKRSTVAIENRAEDAILDRYKRDALRSNANDSARNFAVAAWMIRKHLDYVSTFAFQSKTGDPDLDKRIEDLVAWWARPENFDAARRHSLHRSIRIAEARRTLDGDMAYHLRRDGRTSGIEGDRFRNPKTPDDRAKKAVQGLQLGTNGEVRAAALHARTKSGFAFDRWVDARYLRFHGYYDRFDQVRGVSPLASGLNTLRDLYENFDHALTKTKLSRLLGLAIYRDATEDESLGLTSRNEIDQDGDGDVDVDDQDVAGGYEVDFSDGLAMLDLDPGDRAEMLESKTPPVEFQTFTSAMVGVALKSLDIPYSFYDESHSNYSGSRQALLQYEESAKIKRADNRALLASLTRWRLAMFVQAGTLELPRGMNVRDLAFDWIASGLPWIDPLKETNANALAITAGIKSRTEICKERGRDFGEVVAELQAEAVALRDAGLGTDPKTTKDREE